MVGHCGGKISLESRFVCPFEVSFELLLDQPISTRSMTKIPVTLRFLKVHLAYSQLCTTKVKMLPSDFSSLEIGSWGFIILETVLLIDRDKS